MEQQSFAEFFENHYVDYKQGEVIKAAVVAINSDYVVVDANLKSEGYIPISQFRSCGKLEEINVGDEIEVVLESQEDGYGMPVLSFEKVQLNHAWDRVQVLHERGELVSAYVTGAIKGGIAVTVEGLKAFLPGSLVDIQPVKDMSYLNGTTISVKLVKLDRERNNIVVSRKAALSSDREDQQDRQETLSSLKEGSVLTGVVKSIMDYGAFVNLGGVDGLLHITDLSWKRVKHPSEVLNVGDPIEVVITKCDLEQKRISLGLKQLVEDPWQNVVSRYPEGSRLFVKITNITDFGAFAEIEGGVEGLIHASAMDWVNRNASPKKMCTVGEEIEVMVLQINHEKRRISLGMKQCKPNPWKEFAESHVKGEHLTGVIKTVTDFGIFVGLEMGLDGLVHVTDLTHSADKTAVLQEYKKRKGQNLEVMMLSADHERERIALGIKQLEEEKFLAYLDRSPKGTIVEGEIIRVDAKGATVSLAEEVTGYLRANEMSRNEVEDASAHVRVGDKVSAKITSVDRKSRNIALSIKALEIANDQKMIEDYRAKPTSSQHFGDILKQELDKNTNET